MKRLFAVALGILTAIGGFVDIGDIVANTETGARFGMSLAWVVAVGVIGICLFAEMAGRVATVSKRATFDLVRERLGARVALVNLVASFFITFLTLAAEIGGVAPMRRSSSPPARSRRAGAGPTWSPTGSTCTSASPLAGCCRCPSWPGRPCSWSRGASSRASVPGRPPDRAGARQAGAGRAAGRLLRRHLRGGP